MNKIELPQGWTVKEDDCVGYSYFDDKGKIIAQHPFDNNAIRTFCWQIFTKTNDK
jgi:hypothetical protein